MTERERRNAPTHQSGVDSSSASVWVHNAEMEFGAHPGLQRHPVLKTDVVTDVVVVGAGITGITTALLLQQAGYDVVVADAHTVGYGVSGFNSGHVTSMLLDMKFHHIISVFGEEATRAITLGIESSIDLIERLIRDYRIDCEFRRVPGYLFAEIPAQLSALQQEYDAASKAGLALNRTFSVPLPFPVEEGIFVPNQAVINPLLYIRGLAEAFCQGGGHIYEQSRVERIEHDVKSAEFDVHTPQGVITAAQVVLATHTPIGFRPAIQTRLEAFRSYIIGIRTEDQLPDAVFWDMEEPYHYIRQARDEYGPLLLIGGEDHKTGEQRETQNCFRKLEQYAQDRFQVQSVDYRWSAQLYNSVDGLPYIGPISGVYLATGFSGEGLTFGTLAARMITDQLVGLPNDCSEILSPTRTKPLASAGGFLSENLGTVGHFVGDRLKKPDVSNMEDIPLGEGALCDIRGHKAAVYHAPDGSWHAVSPVCTHMNCIVQWNSAEKSWDCPCHGGRFSATGNVLNGPPVTDLQPINLDVESPTP